MGTQPYAHARQYPYSYSPLGSWLVPRKCWGDDGLVSIQPRSQPIEHLWFRLKELVNEVNPDIEDVDGDDEKVWDTLLQQELLDDLIKPIDTQVNVVLEAEVPNFAF